MRIEIRFETNRLAEEFINLYRGPRGISYHPNYQGQVETDSILGSGQLVVYLDRSKVVDFARLGQDIMMFRGRIVG